MHAADSIEGQSEDVSTSQVFQNKKQNLLLNFNSGAGKQIGDKKAKIMLHLR